MKPAIIWAVLTYTSQASPEELYCDAAVICPVGAQSCIVVPTEKCWGTYDPAADELRGSWNMSQCLNAELHIGKSKRAPILGCAIGAVTAEVDADAVKSKGSK